MIDHRLPDDQEASMPDAPYRVAHVSEIVTPEEAESGTAGWRATRIHFGIQSFGISAYVAESAGDVLSADHTESEDGTGHEELFFVASGHASFRIDGETVDAPAGTFVYVPDPAARRGASALEAGTTLLAIGGEPGKAFAVSPFEREYVDGS
jgi:mannose-6-phosphate isomerase-like protein (cupin superfamily)